MESKSFEIASTCKTSGRSLRKGWRMVRFGDVVRNLKETVNRDNTELTRYVAGEHMDSDDPHLRRWGEMGEDYLGPAFHRAFRKGQVLYGSRRTYLKKGSLAPFDGICANTTFVLESSDRGVLLPDLLPFLMLADDFTQHSIRESKGSVNPYVNWKDIAKYEFALPPKDEQRHIVNILWASAQCVAGMMKACEAAMDTRNAAHRELFSEATVRKDIGGRALAAWTVRPLGTVCEIANTLRKPINASERAKMQGPYPYYGPTGILDHLNEYRVEGEYVLIGEDGDHFLKYRDWEMTQLVQGRFNVNNHAHILRGKGQCSTKWLYHYFKHRDIMPYLARQGSGRLKLNKATLETIPIPVPPIAVQARIVKSLDCLDLGLTVARSHLACQRDVLTYLRENLLQAATKCSTNPTPSSR